MRGKPIEVRMAMLSSGGELPSGAAPVRLSPAEGPGSIMEGRVSGSAKSEKETKEKIMISTFPFMFNLITVRFCFGGQRSHF